MLPVNDYGFAWRRLLLHQWFGVPRSLLQSFAQLPSFFFLLFFILIDAFLNALGNQFGLFFRLRRTLRGFRDLERFFLSLLRRLLISLFIIGHKVTEGVI